MAIPIISGVLGAFGVEAAKEAAGAADELLGALFGKRASEVMEEVGARFRGYAGEVPPNHDLERTLRLIQLSTNLYLLRDYQGWEDAERFDTRAATPPPFIAAAHAWVRDQIGLCPRMTVVENAPLVAEMERALDALLRSGNPTEAALARIAAVETAAWDELVAGAGEAPSDFRARFFGEAEGTPAWRDILRALLREALKDKPRVKIAFDISRLAALREDTTAIGHAVAALAGDTALLRAEMARIARDVAATRRNTEDLLQGQQRLPAAIVEQLMAAMEARGHVARAHEEGLERRTILALAKRLRNEDAPDLDQAIAALDQAVEIALATIRRGERPSNADAFVDQVLAQVARQTRAGAFDAAARTVDDGLAELDRREAEQRASFQRSRASLLEAGIAQDTLRRDAPAVARRVEALVALDHPERPNWAPAFRAKWDAFQDEGEAKGVNFALEVAAALAARMRDTATTADERGAAGNMVAISLWVLGGRESGAARLEEALAAFRLALKEHRRDRVPLNWAATQNNLGNALRTLGKRESGTERLEEAVAAYRLALEEHRRDRVALSWAMTQNNLGIALQTLGARESRTERLEEAVAAYRLALEERRRDRVPLDWAATQNNLGTVLQTLGGRESGTARLEEAVAAYRLALEENRRDRVALSWAMTQNNLGGALWALGERESGTARLEEAVAACRLALEERRRDRAPFLWAQTIESIALAKAALGTRETPRQHWQSALDHVTAALEEYTRAGATYHIATATTLRDRLLARLASLP